MSGIVARAARNRTAELLVVAGAAAILGCDLIDPTLDARIYAASEHALGPAAWLFHTGLALLFLVVLLLYVRLRTSPAHRGVRRGLVVGAIAAIGVVVFPTDPGWGVVSVPGRLHPIFALLAAGSLLIRSLRCSRRGASSMSAHDSRARAGCCCTPPSSLAQGSLEGSLAVVQDSPNASRWRLWGCCSISARIARERVRSS
ncbi:MAG: hypothetical protein RI921_1050 [Chloroflexota bacterium]